MDARNGLGLEVVHRFGSGTTTFSKPPFLAFQSLKVELAWTNLPRDLAPRLNADHGVENLHALPHDPHRFQAKVVVSAGSTIKLELVCREADLSRLPVRVQVFAMQNCKADGWCVVARTELVVQSKRSKHNHQPVDDDAPVLSVRGVGKTLAKHLADLGVHTVRDLHARAPAKDELLAAVNSRLQGKERPVSPAKWRAIFAQVAAVCCPLSPALHPQPSPPLLPLPLDVASAPAPVAATSFQQTALVSDSPHPMDGLGVFAQNEADGDSDGGPALKMDEQQHDDDFKSLLAGLSPDGQREGSDSFACHSPVPPHTDANSDLDDLLLLGDDDLFGDAMSQHTA